MKVIATPEQTKIPEVDALSHVFRTLGGTNRMVSGMVEHTLSSAGEMYFDQIAYSICVGFGLIVDRAIMYVEQPASVLDELVPDVFPDSANDDGTQMTWKDYVFSHVITDSGTVLLRVAHHSMREGLDNDTRVIWHNHFGGLLTKAEGLALVPTVVEP